MINRWATMSPEERTDYISKLKAGSEPLRFAMIDAWNNSFDLLKDLSLHLSQNQVYKPTNMLYSAEEFSKFQSKVMKEFWQTHTEESIKLGQAIKDSQEKIEQAIIQGTFEDLKKQILKEKNIRIKNLENYKITEKEQPTTKQTTTDSTTDNYKIEFKKAYNTHVFGKIKSVPKKYYDDLYETVLKTIPESAVKAWTKNLRGEQISSEEMVLLKKYVENEFSEISRYNRAFEAAMADAIYNCSNDASAYEMSNSDVKIIMSHLESGNKKAVIQSHKTGKFFELNFAKNKVDSTKINRLYELYKRNVPKQEIDEIIYQYFEKMDTQTQAQLHDYINQYGQSIFIIFSDKSLYSTPVKEAFYKKFKNNMPKELAGKVECFIEKHGFAYEKELQKLSKMRAEKFYFCPTDFIDAYNNEVSSALRSKNNEINMEMLKLSSKKRTNIKDNGKLLIVPKHTMFFENRLKSLAMSQALADILYEITKNENVYFLPLEQLADNIELFNLCRTFPTEERIIDVSGLKGMKITLVGEKRPNIRNITKLYNDYYKELKDLMKEIANGDDVTLTDFVYILNPDENRMMLDIAVARNVEHVINMNLAREIAKEYYAD